MQELLYKLQIYDMQFSNTSNVQQCIYYMQFSLVICYNCLYMCCKLIGDKEIAVSQFSVQYYILLLSFLLHSVYKKLCFSSIISSKHFMQLTLDSSLCFLSFFVAFSSSLHFYQLVHVICFIGSYIYCASFFMGCRTLKFERSCAQFSNEIDLQFISKCSEMKLLNKTRILILMTSAWGSLG